MSVLWMCLAMRSFMRHADGVTAERMWIFFFSKKILEQIVLNCNCNGRISVLYPFLRSKSNFSFFFFFLFFSIHFSTINSSLRSSFSFICNISIIIIIFFCFFPPQFFFSLVIGFIVRLVTAPGSLRCLFPFLCFRGCLKWDKCVDKMF